MEKPRGNGRRRSVARSGPGGGVQAGCTGTGTPLRVGVHPQCHVSLLFPCGLGLGDRRSLPAGHARKLQSVWPPGETLCSRAGLAGARSELGKVASSAPSSCPGQGKGVSAERIRGGGGGCFSSPFS